MPKTLLCEDSLAYGEPKVLTYTLPKIVHSEGYELFSQGEKETECHLEDDLVLTKSKEENYETKVDEHINNEIDNTASQLSLDVENSSEKLQLEENLNNLNVEKQQSVVEPDNSVSEENISDDEQLENLEGGRRVTRYRHRR